MSALNNLHILVNVQMFVRRTCRIYRWLCLLVLYPDNDHNISTKKYVHENVIIVICFHLLLFSFKIDLNESVDEKNNFYMWTKSLKIINRWIIKPRSFKKGWYMKINMIINFKLQIQSIIQLNLPLSYFELHSAATTNVDHVWNGIKVSKQRYQIES